MTRFSDLEVLCTNCGFAWDTSLLCVLAFGVLFLAVSVHTNDQPWRSSMRTVALLRPLFKVHCVVYALGLLLTMIAMVVILADGEAVIARAAYGTAATLLIFVTIASNACKSSHTHP